MRKYTPQFAGVTFGLLLSWSLTLSGQDLTALQNFLYFPGMSPTSAVTKLLFPAAPAGYQACLASLQVYTDAPTTLKLVTGTGPGCGGAQALLTPAFPLAPGFPFTFGPYLIPPGVNVCGVQGPGAQVRGSGSFAYRLAPNLPPVVTMTAPADQTPIAVNVAVTLTATASDPDGTIASVVFWVDGTNVGTVTAAPYSVSWTPLTAGPHLVTAVAFDQLTLSTTSAPITLLASTAVPISAVPISAHRYILGR